ncbi:MAG: hypothetical protein KDD52_10195 [Bdellovibrionales bacterium]|nr:hypothetical protein [Bdellovibrionales bacterium]
MSQCRETRDGSVHGGHKGVLRYCAFVLIVCSWTLITGPFHAFASSGGEDNESTKTESEAEGKKGEKPESPAKGGGEYAKLRSQKLSFELQIQTHQKAIEDLIIKKNSTKDPEARAQAVQDLASTHGELQKAIDQYNKIIKDLTYRFPEKGDESQRHYVPVKNRSIEQMEEEMGLDVTLTRLKEVVQKKYAPLVDPSESQKNQGATERRPSSTSRHDSRPQEDDKRLKLVK